MSGGTLVAVLVDGRIVGILVAVETVLNAISHVVDIKVEKNRSKMEPCGTPN